MQFPDCNFCNDSPSYHYGRCCPLIITDPSLADKKSTKTRRSLKRRVLKPLSGQFLATACKSSCGCMGACEEIEFLDEEKLHEIEQEKNATRRAIKNEKNVEIPHIEDKGDQVVTTSKAAV